MRNGKKVIVIKIGSSTLVNEQGKLDRAYFDGLAAQVHALRQMGWSPLIVSSAAIACGLEALGIEERPTDMPSLQAAASVGQNALMATYAEAFSRYDVLTSCVLITRHSTAQRNAYLHARDTLERLIDFDVVPIINENDTVSVWRQRHTCRPRLLLGAGRHVRYLLRYRRLVYRQSHYRSNGYAYPPR